MGRASSLPRYSFLLVCSIRLPELLPGNLNCEHDSLFLFLIEFFRKRGTDALKQSSDSRLGSYPDTRPPGETLKEPGGGHIHFFREIFSKKMKRFVMAA